MNRSAANQSVIYCFHLEIKIFLKRLNFLENRPTSTLAQHNERRVPLWGNLFILRVVKPRHLGRGYKIPINYFTLDIITSTPFD